MIKKASILCVVQAAIKRDKLVALLAVRGCVNAPAELQGQKKALWHRCQECVIQT